MVETFYGQTRSTVTCGSCGFRSHTYETFSDLQIDVPERDNARWSVEQGLREKLKPETVEDFHCVKCRRSRK